MTALDPNVARLLPELETLLAVGAGPEPELAALREGVSGMLDYLHDAPVGASPGSVRDDRLDTTAGPVPVRLYQPELGDSDVVVFFHGGGWMVGDCDSADRTCRALAEHMNLTVVSVDYRLAPEHPFPAALHDCLGVVQTLAAQRPSSWLGLVGDSAGGNLAAAVSLAAAASSVRVDAQLLIYPVLDSRRNSASYKQFADGYLLTSAAMASYWNAYAASEERSNPLLSPSHESDPSQFPATVITTAGFDPLHDEGQEFAARLVGAGVPTIYLPAPTLTHAWLEMDERVPAARNARDEAFTALNLLRSRARQRDLQASAR